MRASNAMTNDAAVKPVRTRQSKAPLKTKSTLEKSCFVYVLGSFHMGRHVSYVGWTNDVARRLSQHNSGTGARSTRGRSWALLHTEAFETRNEAMSREWHLKRDRAFRKRLLEAAKLNKVVSARKKAAR